MSSFSTPLPKFAWKKKRTWESMPEEVLAQKFSCAKCNIWFYAVSWWNRLYFNLRKVTNFKLKFLYWKVALKLQNPASFSFFSYFLLHLYHITIVLLELFPLRQPTEKGTAFSHNSTVTYQPYQLNMFWRPGTSLSEHWLGWRCLPKLLLCT